MQNLLGFLEEYEYNIIDAYLSDEIEEVFELVSGYLLRTILKKNEYEECKDIMFSKENDDLPKKSTYKKCLSEA